MEKEKKRLFFAFEVHAPWPVDLPRGRLLDESARHLTIAFLGNVHWIKLQSILDEVPLPPLKVGAVGEFDKTLFLPRRKPHVVAWHIKWSSSFFDFNAYQQSLSNWLDENGFPIKQQNDGFLSHVTLCRSPFSFHEWKKVFKKTPVYISNFHLYESKPGLMYTPIWTHPITPPFNEDYIFAEDEDQLLQNAAAFSKYHGIQIAPRIHSIEKEKGIIKCPVKSFHQSKDRGER